MLRKSNNSHGTLSVLIAGLGLMLARQVTAQTPFNCPTITLGSFRTLHDFTVGSDGGSPFAGLILSGNTLYGTASEGGSSGYGAVFEVNTNGRGYTILYSFTGGSDGAHPEASLILSGNTLYGTARNGGLGHGTVFAVNTDGTGFTTLHSFTGGDDGADPIAALILSGNTLYGTADSGGSQGHGTVFALNTNGTAFTTLHNFIGGNDGANPEAGLVLSGNTLYGTAYGGGGSGWGTVFAVNTNGTAFTSLHEFTSSSDGGGPSAGLVLSGNTLYGTTFFGGSSGGFSGAGTVFAVNTDRTGFTNLHSFTGSDGGYPDAGLILVGNTLYGTALYGGNSGWGSVFAVNTNGTGFRTLVGFGDGVGTGKPSVADGAEPTCGLILAGNTLYGTASVGGESEGTVYAVNTNGTGFKTLHVFTSGSDGGAPAAGLILSGNTLYGTAQYGGLLGQGTVFAVNADGAGFTNLYSFTGGSDGAAPYCGLILSGNTLYGTAQYGGLQGQGVVFKVNTDGTGFTNLYGFTGGSDGADPVGVLVLSGNTLYGTTFNGGSGDNGTVFALNTDGTGFTNLYRFTGGSDGASPVGVLALSGNTLYGTAYFGGSTGNGVVFGVNTDGTGFTNLHSFTNGSDGANPLSGLVLSGNTLYGTAQGGGNLGWGTVFAVGTDGTGFTTLYTFTFGSDGGDPFAGLILLGSTLYGTTVYDDVGGLSGDGTVFAVNTNNTGFTTLHIFAGSDGSVPFAGLILSGNTLYGTTSEGGRWNNGTVFSLALGAQPVITLGVAYNETNAASGGSAPYTYAVTSGSLPSGLSLTANGILSGIPVGLGTNTFTITATDANGCTGSASYTMEVTAVEILPPQVSAGGNAFSFSFATVSGQSYTIQESTNAPPANWLDVTSFIGDGSLFQFSLPVGVSIPYQFFRVSVP